MTAARQPGGRAFGAGDDIIPGETAGWGPSSFAKLVNISITIVYDTYNL